MRRTICIIATVIAMVALGSLAHARTPDVTQAVWQSPSGATTTFGMLDTGGSIYAHWDPSDLIVRVCAGGDDP
ncbi:hypothetical protein COW53_02300, partial [bacterium CG17_big_fil_post_rev_8_21_14_2_50_64_8]